MRHLSLSCFVLFFSTFGLKSPPSSISQSDNGLFLCTDLQALAAGTTIVHWEKRLLMLCTWPSLSLNNCTFKATFRNCSTSSPTKRNDNEKCMNGKPSQRQRHGSAFIYLLFTPSRGFLYYYVVGVFMSIVFFFASSATGRSQPTWQTGFILKVCPHTCSYNQPGI